MFGEFQVSNFISSLTIYDIWFVEYMVRYSAAPARIALNTEYYNE